MYFGKPLCWKSLLSCKCPECMKWNAYPSLIIVTKCPPSNLKCTKCGVILEDYIESKGDTLWHIVSSPDCISHFMDSWTYHKFVFQGRTEKEIKVQNGDVNKWVNITYEHWHISGCRFTLLKRYFWLPQIFQWREMTTRNVSVCS